MKPTDKDVAFRQCRGCASNREDAECPHCVGGSEYAPTLHWSNKIGLRAIAEDREARWAKG